MNPIVITPPAQYPVTTAEAKLQLSIDTDDYDPRIAALIAAATEHIETHTGRALITRTYRGFLNWWPYDPLNGGVLKRFVQLEKPPLQSITDLITYDDSDNPTTFSPSLYYVDTTRTLGRIVLRRGIVWPIPLRVANGIQIDWIAGYGDNPASVPEPIRLAIQMMIGFLNEQRGDEASAIATPTAVEMLLAPYVVWPPA